MKTTSIRKVPNHKNKKQEYEAVKKQDIASIPASSLNNQQTIKTPTYQPSKVDTSLIQARADVIAEKKGREDQAYQKMKSSEQAMRDNVQNSNLESDYMNLRNEHMSGYDDQYNQQLQKIIELREARAKTKNAGISEYNDQEGTGTGTPSFLVQGQQRIIANRAQEVLNNQDAEIATQLAMADMIRGDRASAEKMVDKLFELKKDRNNREYNMERDFYSQNSQLANKFSDERYKQVESDYDEVRGFTLQLMKNGAPASVIENVMNSKTLDEAQKVKGVSNHLMSQGERLDLAIKNATLRKKNFDYNQAIRNSLKVDEEVGFDNSVLEKDDDFKKMKGISELQNALSNYKTAVQEKGISRKGGKDGNVLDTRYQEVLQAYRAAKDLGQLQGGDLELIDEAVKKATYERNFGTVTADILTIGGAGAIKRNIKEDRVMEGINEAIQVANENMNRQKTLVEAKIPNIENSQYYSLIANQNTQFSEDDYIQDIENQLEEDYGDFNL